MSMNLLQVIKEADLIAKGKIRTIGPTGEGSDIFSRLSALANILISEWESTMQGDEPIDWNSLFDPNYVIGQIESGQSIYPLPGEVRKVLTAPQACFVISGENNRQARFKLVHQVHATKPLPRNSVLMTANGFQFSRDFTDPSDAAFVNVNITIPAFLNAPMVGNEKDIVPVDNPRWLVNRLAAELVRNDIVKQSQYTNLMQISNSLLKRMISDNNSTQAVRTVPIQTRPFTGTLIPHVR